MANKKIVPCGTMVMHLGNGKTAYGTIMTRCGIPAITLDELSNPVEPSTFIFDKNAEYSGKRVILKLETKEAVYGLFRMLSRIMVEYDARDIKAFHESLEEEEDA